MIALFILIPALLFGAQATRQCTSCIPLADLLSEAYGVEIVVDGLSSAVAFHNGTMEHISSTYGSSEYYTVMQSIVDKQVGLPPQIRTSRCPQRQQSPPSSSLLGQGLVHYFTSTLFRQSIFRKRDSQQPVAEEPPEPINPNVRLFQTEMEALAPFLNMSRDQKSKVSISLSIPGWLTGTEEVCQIAEAAARTFGRGFVIENHASASYTALGYELCRIDYGYFDCTGPGRIMTIDLQKNDLVVLSQLQTPLLYWATDPVTFAASKGLSHSDKVEWINSFVSSQHPDMVMITGPGANEPHLQQAIQSSKASSLLISQSSVPADKVAAMGAAQAAKDNLERQFDDCGEPDECYMIRREADQIGGKFSPLKPSIWPSAGLRHFHDEL